ncbi:MATE family efflux transporter [[Limnothrix rosea] IAM M-220]|uniref:MATE family efflux transporter n=1 Tax=[Limnothrix rosea] IAM M-220 TaxID=454133 RepID=UPI00096479C1|nr:MATE family efflux transporter [[Limnothrix rosea] IAM M-220]OKH13767.1 MATE family efflux transporter [[Limnothrix rosea] IAM M-220]
MKQSLTEGSIRQRLTKLTLPMVWGILAIVAFNLADTYFVGQLGTNQLAAMSFTFPVVMTLGSLAMGLGIGASSIIARAIGQGDRRRVQRFTTNSLTLGVVAVALLASLGLLTIEPLFTALGANETLMPFVQQYMQIWYFGIVFLVIPMIGNSAIRAAGDTVTPSLIMMFAAGLNILLDPFLIFGVAGFPELGLAGAAWATVIARAITLVASLCVLKFKEDMLSSYFPNLEETLWCWRDILYVGLPAAGATMITPISIGVITSLLATYGAVAVAGFGIASRIESFAMIALMALSASIGPFVGQNWGAKKYGRVAEALRQSYIFCLGWGICMAIALAIFGSQLATLFNNNNEVIEVASKYLWLVPITYGAGGIIQVASSAFNALGKPTPAITMTTLRMFVFYIPLAYIGSRFFEITGIFFAATLSNIFVGIIAFRWSSHTQKQLVECEKVTAP